MPDDPITLRRAPFGRVLTAMVTPFHDDGGLDLDGAARLAEHLVTEGCDGLVISGTTGESPTTTDTEKDQLLRAVLDAVGDRATVVAGVGTYDTHHTVELARHAEKAGAHGLLVVTPFYSKPPQEGCAATSPPWRRPPGCPSCSTTSRSFRGGDRDRDVGPAGRPRPDRRCQGRKALFASSEVMARTELAYYSGDDALNLAHLTQGAIGVVRVVAHVAASRYAAMVTAVDAGDLPDAVRIHRELIPAVRAIMTRTQGAIMAKAAGQLTGVLTGRAMRSPLIEATEEQVAELRAELVAAGLL